MGWFGVGENARVVADVCGQVWTVSKVYTNLVRAVIYSSKKFTSQCFGLYS